jgi:hypothetical protein
MSRARVLIGLAAAGVLIGSAAPALADGDDNTRVCLVLTHDRNNPGPAPLCVWVPVGQNQVSD